MSATAPQKRRALPPGPALPLLAYFEEDSVARIHLGSLQRWRRIPFDRIQGGDATADCVLLVSMESLVEKHYGRLRVPNVRVLGLSHGKFRDARNDGAVYAYLPPDVPAPLLERMVDNALEHLHLIQSRHELNQRLTRASREIGELNQIGAALSAEHDAGALLNMILTKSREFTRSDAGSIYLVERVPLERSQRRLPFRNRPRPQGEMFAEHLRFRLAQNDSVHVPFRELTMEINKRSIAGYVALTGETVCIEDAYHPLPEVPYAINRKFDEDSGYRTRSILATPMKTPQGKIVGVLQLINAKRDFQTRLSSPAAVAEQVAPYTERQRELVLSLASQAAVALENSRLYESIQRLFEGFVKASVTAIEARDPATSGHSFRVANLTVALAEAVSRGGHGELDVRFSRDQMREIRYASLLHDFGKVGVKEEVLVKAKKLYPAQLEGIRQRFNFIQSSLEKEALQSKLQFLLEKGREEFLREQEKFDAPLAEAVRRLDEFFAAILQANEPTVLPEGHFQALEAMRAFHYYDRDGSRKALLTGDEARLLSIRQGSLDEEERRQVEAHVVHTFNFLQQIPWTPEIRHIPEIARGHHEKLNGAGYPYKLSAPEIPLPTRMMTISDIFDALAAYDRPYKKAVSPEHALEILDQAVQDGEIDSGLFQIFKAAKVYERWNTESFSY